MVFSVRVLEDDILMSIAQTSEVSDAIETLGFLGTYPAVHTEGRNTHGITSLT